MKTVLMLVSISLVLTSCKACLGKLYRVHEEMTPIRIEVTTEFSDSVLNAALDEQYKNDTNTEESSCYPIHFTVDKSDRKVCFTEPPCECYWISVEHGSLIIKGLYIPHLSRNVWFVKQEEVKDSTLIRVRDRLENYIVARIK